MKSVIQGNVTAVMCVLLSLLRLPVFGAPAGVDWTFSPDIGQLLAVVVQGDGRILVGSDIIASVHSTPPPPIKRLNSDGSLDESFNPVIPASANTPFYVTVQVSAIAVQSDGKIVIGGDFETVNGFGRTNLARLNADGSLDMEFAPQVSPQYIGALALDREERVLMGGQFTNGVGEARRLIRLKRDGTVDESFDPNPNGVVWAIRPQADGTILVGGNFSQMSGSECRSLARISDTGVLDTGFMPEAATGKQVYTLAVQPDGKIIVPFSNQGVLWGPASFVRLGTDGTIDPDFQTNQFRRSIRDIALQANGKMVLGGQRFFNDLRYCVQLDSDGTVAVGELNSVALQFQPNDAVVSVAIDAQGRILMGGGFEHTRRYLNEPAVQSLIVAPNRIEWVRSGSSPEVDLVLFELSTDDGTTWSHLERGTRTTNGWELTGMTLPEMGRVRARGRTVSVHSSAGWVEDVTDFRSDVVPLNQAPSFTKGPSLTVNEDAGPQTIINWAKEISPGPPNESGQKLTFIVTSDTPLLFAAEPAISPEGTLTFTPATDAVGKAGVTIVLKDDGGTINGGTDSSLAQTFEVLVRPVNDAPRFDKGADQIIVEDAGSQNLVNWASNISVGVKEDGQRVRFDGTNNNANLFAVQPVMWPDGTVSYQAAPNASGMAEVTVFAIDDGGRDNGGEDSSAPQTFRIIVLPVNDAPSFVKGADVTVNEDAGPQRIGNWATEISPGPANESMQALSFIVTNDNKALFVTQPSVSVDGTLTFTTATNANGTAVITVEIRDDGGIADGGRDASDPETFRIVVRPVNDPPIFNIGANQTIYAGAGPQRIANWATGIRAGPLGDEGTTVMFLVENNNPGIFSEQPMIAVDGSLSFAPAPGASGIATVTVRAKDDGGTENGGENTSLPLMFQITVAPPPQIRQIIIRNGATEFVFAGEAGATYTVLRTMNLLLPVSEWEVVGRAAESDPREFRFMDSPETNRAAMYYRVRNP